MSNLIFIGTLHAHLTPHHELQSVLEEYQPELLLVEISQEDIDNDSISKYPDEMVFAYQWAQRNDIKVAGFDCDINTLAEGVNEKDNHLAIKEQAKVLAKYSWQEANTVKVDKLLDTPLAKKLDDPQKVKLREQKMLQNVEKMLECDQKIVVVTGSGHLNFFEECFPQALFPLRYK